jgi:hypothetical protein
MELRGSRKGFDIVQGVVPRRIEVKINSLSET